jgi:tetratricopeptide (TPR) repeat protein
MKPIGSITLFYRFLDAEDRAIMDAIMEKATGYVDFIHMLGQHLLKTEASPKLVHVCVRLARTIESYGLMERLGERYPENDLIRPHYVWARVRTGTAEVSALEEATRVAIEAPHDDWIAFSFHFLRLSTDLPASTKAHLDNLSAMDRIVKDNPELSFLGSYVPYLISMDKEREGFIDEAIDLRKKSVAIAVEFDDYILAIPILRELAPLMMKKYPSEAMRIIKNLEDYYPHLGTPASESSYYQSIRGYLHLIRGEFDTSVEAFERAIDIVEKQHPFSTLRNVPHRLALTYLDMGRMESAAEWANFALASKSTSTAYPFFMSLAHLILSCALCETGDVDEAEEQLSLGHELSLKIGNESILIYSYYASGLIDIAQNDILSGMASLERALEIAERLIIRDRIHSILLKLVECEIALSDADVSEQTSGLWMDRLESVLQKDDFPGIRGLSSLLKARFRIKQGRIEEAYEILKETRTLASNPGLQYLNEKTDEVQSKAEHTSG